MVRLRNPITCDEKCFLRFSAWMLLTPSHSSPATPMSTPCSWTSRRWTVSDSLPRSLTNRQLHPGVSPFFCPLPCKRFHANVFYSGGQVYLKGCMKNSRLNAWSLREAQESYNRLLKSKLKSENIWEKPNSQHSFPNCTISSITRAWSGTSRGTPSDGGRWRGSTRKTGTRSWWPRITSVGWERGKMPISCSSNISTCIFMIVWTFAGPFLLTHLLLDKVMSSGAPGGGGDSRIIHVSSDAHLTKFDFEGLKFYLW